MTKAHPTLKQSPKPACKQIVYVQHTREHQKRNHRRNDEKCNPRTNKPKKSVSRKTFPFVRSIHPRHIVTIRRRAVIQILHRADCQKSATSNIFARAVNGWSMQRENYRRFRVCLFVCVCDRETKLTYTNCDDVKCADLANQKKNAS